MDPIRLQFLIVAAIVHSKVSPYLADDLYSQALRQLYARWPLVGCAVQYDGPITRVILVGRQ